MDSADTRQKVATCTRILCMQGLLGLFGHISVFDPQTKRVFISPGFGSDKGTTEPKDVLVCDLEGQILEGGGHLPIEWPIHTTLHAARPDALSVFHLHAPYATLYAIVQREFRPVTLQGTIFADGLPLYCEPQLVKTVEQGQKLAELIGAKRGALLRGHGTVIVGRDIEEALYCALILEDDARKAVQAGVLGELHRFSYEESQIFGGNESLSRRAHRAWGYLEKLEQRWDRQPATGLGQLA